MRSYASLIATGLAACLLTAGSVPCPAPLVAGSATSASTAHGHAHAATPASHAVHDGASDAHAEPHERAPSPTAAPDHADHHAHAHPGAHGHEGHDAHGHAPPEPPATSASRPADAEDQAADPLQMSAPCTCGCEGGPESRRAAGSRLPDVVTPDVLTLEPRWFGFQHPAHRPRLAPGPVQELDPVPI